MHFVSLQFLAFFLVVFAVYWSLPLHRARMVWLLAMSCVFYMSWNPLLILLILFSAFVDYLAALGIEGASPAWRKRLLIGSISINLGLLGLFKYMNFFLDNAAAMCQWAGVDWQSPVWQIALPLG